MNRRITDKDLSNLIRILNEETGNPVDYFDSEKKKCNPGNFHLDSAYGGVALCRTCNDAGGASNIIGRGTKQWLYDQIQTYRAGIRFGRELTNAN